MKQNLLFNQTTAIGKRFAMVLTMLVMLGVTQALGALSSPYTCTFTTNLTLNNKQVKTGDVTWTLSTTVGKGSPTTTFGNTNGQSAIKLGSGKSKYYSKMTLTTSAFSSYNITKVVLYISSNNGGSKTITVKQGNIQIGTGNQTFSSAAWVTNCTRNTTKGSGGDLSIEISSDATATFIHSIAITYEETIATKTLSSISVSGQTTSYNVGDDFSFDGICTAKYSDNSTKTVTPSVSTPDMNSAGNKTVTVSYTEGGITVNATYTITVSAPAGGGGDGDCDRWVEVSLSDIQSTDDVVIAMEKSNLIYALTYNSATATSKAPPATLITNDNLKTNSGIANTLRWNISNSNGNLTIYPTGSISTWLYCTNTNNGVRVGTNENKAFAIDNSSGYLKHIGTSRYIGVYFNQDTGNAQDWRCYTSTTSNISGQTLKFYKYVECTAKPTYSVTTETVENCTVKFSKTEDNFNSDELTELAAGDYVHFTITPTSGYKLNGTPIVKDASNGDVECEEVDGIWFFEMPESDVTVSATCSKIVYKVSYDPGSGTCTAGSTTTPGSFSLPSATPSDACQTEDWTFAGWTTNSVSETTTTPAPLYAAGSSYTPTSDITLYAVYQRTETTQGGGSSKETVDFSSQGYTNQQEVSSYDGTNFSVAFDKGTNSNVPKYFTSGTAIRIYGGGYFTISSESTITKIEITFGSNDDTNAITTDVNTYSNGTWTGSANSVIFTIGGTTGHRRIKSLAVTTTGGGSTTTTYNSNPKCCTQPKTPLKITADQIELVKSGVVTLTATGGNGTDITWIATGGVLNNQSNTGATLTISDVDATQNITVTATQAENNNDDEIVYCAQEASIDITVKAQWTITFQTNDNGVKNSNSILVTDGESYTMPDISDEYVCNSGSSFAGWVDNEDDTELDATPNSTQTATADQTWYAAWSSSSNTKSVDIYQLVTDVTNLTAGDKVWITNTTPTVAMGVQNDNNREQVTVTKHPTESDKIYSTGLPATLTIGKNGTYYTFHDGTGYLYAASSSKNYLRRQATNNANGKWSISIASGKATITAQGDNTHNKLKYNSGSSIFSCYESGQGDVRIYKNVGTAEIEVSSASITTNNTSCHRGAVISAENGKWITSSIGQKVRIAINVTARGFESNATLSATSANEHFSIVSITNTTITKNSAFETQMMIEYQPAEANTNENAEITLVAKKGEEVVATRTIDVNGRSLPDEFVIVTLRNDKYYALPANMQSGANQYSGIEVAPNNSLTQIPVAPSTTIYTLRSVAETRYETAGNCVRLVGNSNKCLWGNIATSNTTIQNWTTLSETNGSNYEWLLTTTDGEGYTIANPAHPDYSTGRLLAMSGTQFGLYKKEIVFYILPVGCSSMPANVQVSPRRVDATFSWESNANSTTIDVYTNEAMTSGKISKTASSSPCFFDGLKELTQYWYKITPDGNATCAVTGSFTTTGPTIDVVEWKEDQVVIFVDKDENVNPLVIIDGEVEHNTGSTSATDLFFSKYFEAQGTAKLLAIYNGTTNALPLEEITILHRSKDKNTPLSLASFGKTPGWIQPSEEIILYNVDDREEVMDCAEEDQTFPSWNNVEDKNLEFSGKGTIRLFRGNTCIDIIGAMNSIDDMNNMDASPIEGSEKPEFGDNTGFSTSTGDDYTTKDDEEKNYALSTNRCLLVRKPSVTSGTNAIKNNISDFKTLGNDFTGIANEWAGLQIPNGPSDKPYQYTCEGFKEVGSFDYNKYYKEYNNIDSGTELESYAHDDKTHEYTIDIENLAQYSCLNIRFQLKQGDQILTEAPVQVPIIVNDDKTTDDAIFNQIVTGNTAMSIERCATCNVVVLNNATLTKATDGTKNDVPTIGNLKVYPGGSVIVPNGTNYTINSLALRRQEDEIAMANIQGTLTIKQTKSVYLDVRIDPTNWHYISLPHDCRVGDIFFTDGTPAILNTDYLLGWYDGAYRAEHKTGGWTYITDNDYILKQGLGYIIALPGTDKIKRELRFPMANETITEDKGDKEIGGLYAYGGDKSDQELGPNHKGWNMIGNPYLYTYTADIVKEPLQMGTLSKYGDPWDGSWERTGDARYIVEPIDNGWSGYRQTIITNLKPFTSYFIQVGGELENGEYTTITPETEQQIVFAANRVARNASAPRKVAEAEVTDNHPVWYGIELLAPNNEKDNTTLLISNNFTDGYDMMDDLVKMRGDYYQYYNYPVLASRNDEGEMAFNALPDNSAARVGVPLNYYAAVAGTYTITTDGRFDLEEVKSAILYDATTAQECDLLLEDYTFTTAKGNNSDRFTLFVTVERKKAPSIPTGKDNLLTDGQLSLITIDRTLVLSGLTDKADIYVYDMTGKLIIGARSSGDNGIWRTSVPTSGVYFVRVNGKTEAQTIKAVVK